MPVLCVCLIAGVVSGCIYRSPHPDSHADPSDTACLGLNIVYPLTTMWPGETRRVRLPDVAGVPVPCQLVLRGNSSLGFCTVRGRAYSTTYRTTIMPLPAPASNFISPLIAVATPGGSSSPPRECWVHADSLAAPGDSLVFHVTLTTMTTPERHSHWAWPVRIGVAR
jgi:hypothetical protein